MNNAFLLFRFGRFSSGSYLRPSVLSFLGLLTFLPATPAATVTWDGGGGNNSWQTPANWSSNVVPAANDDVVIDVPGEVTIVYGSGSTAVRSLRCEEGFQLLDGTLTVTGAMSFIHGPLRLTAGTLAVRGAGASFTATGSVTNENTILSAAQGGTLSLPTLQKWVRTLTGDLRITSTDSNSVVDLPGLTQASVADNYQLTLLATSGGRINVPGLAQVNALEVLSEGAGSLIDLSGLSGLVRNTTPGSSRLEAGAGGTILAPNITALDRVDFYWRTTGQIVTGPLGALTGGQLLVDARTNTFPNLTNIIGNNIIAEGGAKVSLPAVTRLARTNLASILFRASEPGSVIALPLVTNAAVEPNYRLRLESVDGGTVSLTNLATLEGAIDAFADGPGSVVELPGLKGRLNNPKAGSAYLEARDGGMIAVTNVTELNRIEVTIAGSGVVTLAQLRSFNNALMRIDGTTRSFPGITNAEGANFLVDDNARLTLSGVTRLERKVAGDVVLTARDNAVLEFPNMTTTQTQPAYQFEAWASLGGRIDLPRFSTTDGALIISSDGINSQVNLPALTGRLANVSGSRGSMEASDGGAILIPNVTQLDGIDFSLQGTGQITKGQITTIANAQLTLDAVAASFPLLGDITGTGVRLEHQATLSLPLVTQLIRTNSALLTYSAASGSVLDLPNVTTALVQPLYQLELFATGGSRIQLPKLATLTGAIDVLAEGTNSVVDLSGLSGVLSNAQAGQSYIEVGPGASVLLPNVTGLDQFRLTIRGTGQFPASQLVSLTRSVVTIDGTTTSFLGLSDTTGTTFKYENGGGAAFQPPTDLVVSSISIPASAVADQPVTMWWEVTNNGTSLTNASWTDALFLSADATLGSDQLIGTVHASGSFLAGSTRRFTNSVILPARYGGTWRVVVAANQSRTVFEGTNFFNNTNLSAGALEIQAPDLVVNSMGLSTNAAQFGQTLNVNWTVRNAGTSPTTATWYDRVVLATNLNALNSGVTLLDRPATESLAANASYTRSATVTLPSRPNLTGGNYVIVMLADRGNSLAEAKETNNMASSSLAVTLPPLPDLAVFSVQAPVNVMPAQTVSLVWGVTNRGTAMATGIWAESIFIAATNTGAPRLPLDPFEVTNVMAAASFMMRTQQVTLPAALTAGFCRFSVEVDSEQSIAESTETNNIGLAPQTTAVPAALKLQVPVASIQEEPTAVTVSALVIRNGSVTAPLTVAVSSSDPAELTVPASVTIAAGQSSAAFPISVPLDGVFDPDASVTIAATATGYLGDSVEVAVKNSDLPQLTLAVANPSVLEGHTVPVNLSHNGPTNSAIAIAVVAMGTRQLEVPSVVTVPAGATSVVFAVLAQDDTLIEPARFVPFQVTAPGFAEGAATLQILDNDLLEFALSLTATSISEGSGAEAVVATVSRGIASPRSLTVEMESSNPNVARVAQVVTIPSGQASVSFPVAAIDDAAIDGAQTTELRAFALATISGTRVAQSTPTVLTVTDDDGPTLTLSAAKELVAEGLSAATVLTILRNGSTNQPLTVSLTSSLPTEATVPSSVTVAAGQRTVTAAVTTINDNVSDGNQTVLFTAAAPAYTSGSVSLVVSDSARPDLVATEINAPANGETEGFVNVSYRIVNQGFGPAGTNWATRVYLSKDALAGEDAVLTDYVFNGTLPVGQHFGQARQIRLPQEAGDYWIVVTTDTAGQIDEVLENNNTGIGVYPIHVAAAYQATVHAALETAPAGTPVALTGSATKTATGGPAPFVLVNIHVGVRGTTRILSAVTDDAGHFATTFTPLPGEAGLYEIGAAHPGVSSAPVQDSFTLLGMKAEPMTARKVIEGSSVVGQIRFYNLGDVPLTGLAATVVSHPHNVQVTASLATNGVLAGFATNVLGFALTANNASIAQGTVRFRVTSGEGAVLNIELPVVAESLQPRLVVNPGELIAGMKVGGQAFVEFEIANAGSAPSEPVFLALPSAPWLRVVSPNPLPPLAPGATNRVTLQLTPPANLPLGAYDGWLGVSAGGTGTTVPFSFRALSEAKGDLRITAVDEYTYFAQGSPKVAGATVTIRDAVSTEVVTNGVTGTNGVFAVHQLTEGYYTIELKADQHTNFRDVILVVAGKETEMQAFLRREAVRYIWTVVPTEIEDRTKVTIETVFEAFVPMPVVTIDPPLLDLADFTADLTQIDLRISNHGLIAAKEAKLNFGTHPEWSFEPLIRELGDLPARSTLTVPLLIRRHNTGGSGAREFMPVSFSPASGGACTVSGNCQFVIECGDSKLGGSASVPMINASASGNCGGGGGGGPGNPGGGGPGGGGGGMSPPPSSSAAIRSCDKCLMAIFSCLLDLVTPDFASCLKDAASCSISLGDNSNSLGDDAYNCMKGVLNCAVAFGELLPIVGDVLDGTECVVNISRACGSSPGGPGGGGGGGGGSGQANGLMALTSGFVPAGAGSGSDTVERAELAILRQRAGWLVKEVGLLRYIMGDDAWFHDPSPTTASNWVAQFIQRIDGATVNARKISEAERAELLAITLPTTVSTNIAHAFLDRWNRSLDYWQAGIARASQVPAGQSTNFIAIDVFRQLGQSAQEVFAESEAAGFALPEQGMRQARLDFIRYMGEGDSGGVCAHVRLRLDQQVVVTRTAFAAALEIENDSLGQLENISIEVKVRRRSGADATAFFATRPPTLEGITAVDGTGRIAANSSGRVTWVLIPTTDAVAGDEEEFLVSGVLKYRQDTLDLTVPLAPASITVYPSASLAVKYFHQRDVMADDPFTVEVEPSVPFSLAVMVQNKGRGPANRVRITSAQPQIVENDKGLYADFKIIATEVAGQNLEPSLTVDFGRIEPATNAIGRWLMTSTILGGFIEYSATFEHLDAIGDKQLSLIEGVEIHELIHIVRATRPIDDGRPDFLVNDVPDLYDRPDTLHLSDGTVAPVSVVAEATFDRAPTTGNLIVQMSASLPAGWAYLRVPDPGAGFYRLSRVMRSDGVEVSLGENFWTSDRTFIGNARRPVRENILHLFDHDSTGQYTLYYSTLPAGDTTAPSSSITALPSESAAYIPVSWSGQDNAGGTGLSFFDVYVSTDGGPFLHWLHQTLDRSAVFQGGFGRSYAFYSVATDMAGNREIIPLTPDASTVVTRTNHAPTLGALGDVVVKEGETLLLQVQADDPDPQDELTFSLGPNSPAGLTIHPFTGVISWVTGEASGPSEYLITVQVLDNGLPRLGAVRTFKVTVSDDNSPPVLNPITNRTINEGRLLTITNVAIDFDRPAQHLTFQLGPGAPAGAAIDPMTGIFQWRPTETQGGTTNLFMVSVRDDGSPNLSATQRFSVVVRDTQSDFVVRVGTTNLLAGTSNTVPLQVDSSADLGWMVFHLAAEDPHLVNLDLESLGDEVAGASFEPIGAGIFRIRFEFDSSRLQSGERTLARLNLVTQGSGHSSIAEVDLQELTAGRSGGEEIRRADLVGGRVFIIEHEPMLDSARAGAGNVGITLYGLPGHRYRLQSATSLGAGAAWQDEVTVQLNGTWERIERPAAGMGRFFRVVEE